MKLLLKIYKDELIFLSLILSLVIWALTTTLLSFREDKVLIITKDKGSYQVLTKEEPNPLEVENFLRYFIGLSLNFDKFSFSKNISKTGDLMSERLWREKKSEFLEMRKYILENNISQSSEILGIKKIGLLNFKIQIKSHTFKKEAIEQIDKSLEIKLGVNERNEANPWGYYVEDIIVK